MVRFHLVHGVEDVNEQEHHNYACIGPTTEGHIDVISVLFILIKLDWYEVSLCISLYSIHFSSLYQRRTTSFIRVRESRLRLNHAGIPTYLSVPRTHTHCSRSVLSVRVE